MNPKYNHPEITLTSEQAEILKALDLLGFRYIVKESYWAGDEIFVCTTHPSDKWYEGGESLNVDFLKKEIFTALSPLMNGDDEEPLCIAEALKQTEEVKT